jgi:hypothetical protein
MPALIHCTGAVHHFVAFRNTPGTYRYLGTAEVAPEVTADVSYLEVKNDLRGRSKPFQLIADGESHQIITTLNRFDYSTWKACKDYFKHTNNLATMGREGRLETGNLVLNQGDFELVLLYDYAGTVAATPDLPAGRRYYSAVVGTFRESTAGNRVQTIAARFDCNAMYNAAGGRTFDLYTENLAGLTLLVN